MENKEKAGIKKKSFELNYDGGTIWCEHLDSMGCNENEVVKKFTEDYKKFSRPSVSCFMIINLDETRITETIVGCIQNNIVNCPKRFLKIAFVGVERKYQREFKRLLGHTTVVDFFNDYEKAKEWMWKRI